MSFRVRLGFECHSTLRVQRGEAEKGGHPPRSQASGSPAGGSEGRTNPLGPDVLPNSPQHRPYLQE